MFEKTKVLFFKQSGYVTVFWFVKSVAITIVHLLGSDLPQNMDEYRQLMVSIACFAYFNAWIFS